MKLDRPAILGIFLGFFCMMMGIGGKDLLLFFNIPSLWITFGGAISATLLNFPSPQLKAAVKAFKIPFRRTQPELRLQELIKNIVSLAEKARKRGLLSLEADLENVESNYLKKGMQYVVDGTDRDLLRLMLETEMDFIQERHKKVQEVWISLGTYLPSFGMIGTILGLIIMLRKIDDAAAIGPGMAVALLTTLYGAISSYLICLPIAGKLKMNMMDERLEQELILEGVLSIQAGESPRIVADRLQTFLPPAIREAIQLKTTQTA